MYRNIIIAAVFILPLQLLAQISGKVEAYDGSQLIPLAGVNVYWEGSGVGTVTDAEGNYEIVRTAQSNQLTASFIGYKSVTKIIISKKGQANFILAEEGSQLTEVEIIARVQATSVDLQAAGLSYKITSKELRKAACCNLSESFETNASVDISFTDPVTGQKQIEMLGLSSKYAMIQRENIPFAKGLNSNTGLAMIPGPFVSGLQLTKGLSSVLNGYESITGQINVDFVKPETLNGWLFNVYGNQGSRFELNAIAGIDLSDHLQTGVLAHFSSTPRANDRNSDQFTDMPTGDHLNFMNRWHWRSKSNNWEGQIGVSALIDNKQGGQLEAINEGAEVDSLWQFNSQTQRLEVFGKNGYLFTDNEYHSVGLIYSFSHDDRSARFGEREYAGSQTSAYFNSIYQNKIGDPKHQYRTGISIQIDQVNEDLKDPIDQLYTQERTEIVPGAYMEYTFEPNPSVTLVAGVRADYNSYFDQILITPRLNLRYAITEKTTFRIGGGRGQRTPNLVAENLNLLASNRKIDFGNWRGPEVGWNAGASLVQELEIGLEKASFSLDAFYTYFESKLIADLDFDRFSAYLINAEGSNSLSIMTQLDLSPVERFEIRIAYKYLRAQNEYLLGQDQNYYIPMHRAFMNFAYETSNRWKFDLTVNWFGSRRLPSSAKLPEEYQRFSWSPDYFTLNTQINKSFENGLELFAGVDNLLNFTQLDPIVSADDPNSAYFDANYVWAPIFGRNIYAGLYLRLDKKNN